MFPATGSGFAWESIYQTTSSTVQWTMSKNDTSYVEYSGILTNRELQWNQPAITT